jgi:hypothetical protein
MVFRVEGEFARVAADGRGDGAPDERAGDVAVAVLNKAHRQECLCYFFAALDHGHLSGVLTRPALTGLSST